MALTDGTKVSVPLLDDFLTIWYAWRREDEGAPKWSRFRPLEHPHLLPHVMLYERIEERFRCVIVGEQAAACLPVKLAGRFIDEAMPAKNLADITTLLNKALSTGSPNFVEKTMAWEPGRDLTSYSTIQLPFSGENGKNPRILSVMSFRTKQV